jgi:hypothetical protein
MPDRWGCDRLSPATVCTTDHNKWAATFHGGSNYSTICVALPEATGGGGDQTIEPGAQIEGQFWCSIYLEASCGLLKATIGKCHMGFEPVAIWEASLTGGGTDYQFSAAGGDWDKLSFGSGAATGMLSLQPPLWLRPESLSALSNGNSVSSWPDSSGNGRTLTQGTGTNQPTYNTAVQNGLPAVVFAGGQIMSIASFPFVSCVITACVVVRLDSNGSYPTILSSPVANYLEPRYQSSGRTPEFVASALSATSGSALALASWHRLTGTFDNPGNATTLYVDGVSAASTTASSVSFSLPPALSIGARAAATDNFSGALGELLVFNRVLSTADRQTVEAYLQAKRASN